MIQRASDTLRQHNTPGRRAYDGWTVWKCPGGARGTLADDTGIAGGRRGVLCFVVLAAATMAWISRGSGHYGALALAGSDSVGTGIRSCSALQLGLRMDGPRHACAGGAAEAVGRRRFRQRRAQPHVGRLG